jgi:hypothetical protein
VGPRMARIDSVMGLGMVLGAQRRGLREDNIVVGSGMVSQAWVRRLRGQRHYGLESAKMAARKGASPWTGTMAWRLRGGVDDGAETPGRTRRWHGLHQGGR